MKYVLAGECPAGRLQDKHRVVIANVDGGRENCERVPCSCASEAGASYRISIASP